MVAGRGIETHDLNERHPSHISKYRDLNSNWFFQIPKLVES